MPLAAVLGIAVVLGVAWMGQRSLIYFPDRSPVPSAADVLPRGEDVSLTASDGVALGAWYAPPGEGCDAVVLVAHGNGGNRAGRAPLARALLERGFGVLLLDYRGYGDSEGRPSEAGLARDVRAARAHLRERGADRLVYLGESIGTGVVAELAAEHPPDALVLRSPFTSLADVGRAAYGVPVGWLLRDRYPVAEHLRQVQVPTAVVYGAQDTIVPTSQSRRVAEVARNVGADVVEVEVPGRDHNDPELAHGEDLIGAVVEVARRAGIEGCG